MSAHYDSYDYSSYWQGREYEHESEIICIKSFLNSIKRIDRAIEIGGGFGRLVPSYVYRSKTVILTDPSSKLLSLAKSKLASYKNIKYVQSRIETLSQKVRAKSFDLVIMIRVMHHLENAGNTFDIIEKLLTPNGYVILEFANKIHFKNVITHGLKGDLAFIRNKETVDVRSEKSKHAKTITFLNYHPAKIKEELEKHNFEIIQMRSVSNIRSPYLKKHLPKIILLKIEANLQKALSYVYFGPSIFILARKKG